MPKPTFILIGVYKSATTWLYNVARTHPEVFVPDYKELHYFTLLDDKRGLDWYEAQFVGGERYAARGEFSPGYLVGEGVAEKIHAAVPDARLVVMLRDPAARVHSHHRMVMRGDNPSARPLPELIRDPDGRSEKERWLLENGLYARNLSRFYRLFDKEQIRPWLVSDVKADPERFYSEFCEFVGVSTPSELPEELFSMSSQGRGVGRPAWYRLHYGTAQWLQMNGLGWLRRGLKRSGVAQLSKRLYRGKPQDYRAEPLSKENRSKLIDFYRDDIGQLEEMLDRDLTAWKTV